MRPAAFCSPTDPACAGANASASRPELCVKKGSNAPPSIQCGRFVVGDARKAQQLEPELVLVVQETSARHQDILRRTARADEQGQQFSERAG